MARNGKLLETLPRATGAHQQTVELLRFCAVGASGYVVNLGVYTVLIRAGLHYLPAAAGAFVVAFVNNYTWHRLWTFRARRARFSDQGLRFLVVALANLGANLLLLHWIVGLDIAKVPAEAIASVLVTPMTFLGSKFWAFGSSRRPAIGPAPS
jgi:putative flippase GtrA